MIRPFNDFKEFKRVTGLDVGYGISIRKKGKEETEYESIITAIDHEFNVIEIGNRVLTLKNLYECFEYCDSDRVWHSFGIKEPEKKPTKFQVGKKYYYFDDSYDEWETTITARYKDPLDGKIKVVFDNHVCKVNTEDDTEWLDEPFMDNVVKATDEVKEK